VGVDSLLKRTSETAKPVTQGQGTVQQLLKSMEQCLDAGDTGGASALSGEIEKRIPEDSPESSKLHFQFMRLYTLMGKFQLALNTAERVLNSFPEEQRAPIYSTMAQARENLGLPLKDVLNDYIKAAETAEFTGDINTAAESFSAAGSVCISLGKKRKALSVLNKALTYRDSLSTKALARVHGNMGILMQRTGSLSEALLHYSITRDLGKKCGNFSIEANALAYMGHVEISMGKKDEGIKKYRDALSIHRSNSNKRGECIILGNLGGALARFGHSEDAIEALKTAIRIAEEIGHTRGVMTFHANIGLAYKQAGNYRKAEKHIRESMAAMGKSGDRRALAVCHLNLSGVLSKQWRMHEAVNEARRSLRFACMVNALTTQARALSNLGSLMMKTDRLEMALNFFREAYRRSMAAEDYSMLSAHTIGESKCLLELGRRQEAMGKYKTVMELDTKYGMDLEATADLKELEEMLGVTGG